jgi:wyosine [tRNA(Phe)-imidazoG37] synthetase (radical SAM superfamily)
MQTVYGPIKSLRYGSSMGINLLGAEKVCSYNCVYCSLGATQLTMNKIRKDYVFPTADEISQSFKNFIKLPHPVDAVVLSGNGEPTLYPGFDEIVKVLVQLRNEHLPGKPLIALTNGAHLDNKKVVQGLNLLDDRVIKLDAGNDKVMQLVNDPLIRINMAKFLSHLQRLTNTTIQSHFFKGSVDNTTNEAIEEWIEVVGMIKPKAIQLMTITRETPLKPDLVAVDEDTLYSIAFKLKKRTSLEARVFIG